MDCVFCRLVVGELPSHKLYEDDQFLAFLDISPTTKGHALVIPKKHVETFIQTDASVLQGLCEVTQKVSSKLMRVLQSSGVNIQINNGSEAGQVVFHTHVHIIPRYAGDGLQLWPQGYTYADQEASEIASKVIKM